MGQRNEGENIVENIYESSLRKVGERIEKGKLILRAEKENEINFKDMEGYIKNHMNEMTKLVKDAKLIKSSTSYNLKNFYNSFVKCEELLDQLSTNNINTRIDDIFSNIIIEINNKCKPVVL
ncbi:conserved Plasmodium protein, unknown function [Plasmodium sp. gorilla clade G3]|nr:conserved Plasmodium protein, unknown function [Plasmodium sp. gorilla clade G3]